METELKLLIDPEHVATLRNHPLLQQYASEPPHEQRLVSTYFDTPDLHFRRRDAGLRVRDTGNGYLQTFKQGGQVRAGLHQRGEWECKIESATPDFAVLRALVEPHGTSAKILRRAGLAEEIAPLFTTHITRTIWELRLPHGAEVEFALDQGSIAREGEGASVPVSEVELEIKSGNPAEVFDFALQLLDTVSMRIGNVSKAARGYALHAPGQPSIVKAARVELARDMTLEQGFIAIVDNCLTHIQGNETGVLEGQDPESVHQMRVGLRRLRSAFNLFKEVLPTPDPLLDDLGWLAGELGAARDWDVLSSSTLAKVDHAALNGAAAGLQQTAADIAQKKRQQAADALKSVRHTRLMLGLSAWLAGRRWRDPALNVETDRLDMPLKKFADGVLMHDQNRLHKRGKHLQHADAQARHRVRIAAKKTRYATEFFQSLYPSKRVAPYVESLSSLQDELGLLNDAAVADHLLHEIEQEHPELATGAGFARGYLAASVRQEDRALQKCWKRFKPMQPPCRK